MPDFKVTILGNGSAVPTLWQNPSSQVVVYENQHFLVDCAEATQMQLIRFKISRAAIDHIFISHLHGDHFYGLIGLISSSHLIGRDKPLDIFAPSGLEELILHQLKISNTTLKFEIRFHYHENNQNGILFTTKNIEARIIPLKHSIPSWGIVFHEKERKLNIDRQFIDKYHPTVEEIWKIKAGEDFVTNEGRLMKNQEITLPAPNLRSYAYCSDTAYDESIIPYIKNVSLLYHESTFDNSQLELAKTVLHSTASQAATIAKKAEVGKLLLGHFSGRYKELDKLEMEAKNIFPNTEISKEGQTYWIG